MFIRYNNEIPVAVAQKVAERILYEKDNDILSHKKFTYFGHFTAQYVENPNGDLVIEVFEKDKPRGFVQTLNTLKLAD